MSEKEEVGMTLRSWLKQFENYSDGLLDKNIKLEAPNGLLVCPDVKMKTKDRIMYTDNEEDIECLVITY